MTSHTEAIQARLDEIQERNPHMLSVAACFAMFTHLDEPYDTFASYIDVPIHYIDDANLRQLAKLAGFAGVTLADLKAFMFRRFAATDLRQVPQAPVVEMLETYRSFGITMGPQMFHRYVHETLLGKPTSAPVI